MAFDVDLVGSAVRAGRFLFLRFEINLFYLAVSFLFISLDAFIDAQDVAAAAAVVLGIFVCADLLRKPYCYIDGVAVYDAEVAMQTTVYLESFSALEESGRMVDELIENN